MSKYRLTVNDEAELADYRKISILDRIYIQYSRLLRQGNPNVFLEDETHRVLNLLIPQSEKDLRLEVLLKVSSEIDAERKPRPSTVSNTT